MDQSGAWRYDRAMAWLDRRGLAHLRTRTWQDLSGRVLEIGAGTGANHSYYSSTARITAFDIDPEGLIWFRQKLGSTSVDLSLNDARYLPFPTGSFDAAVGTLTFCSIADPRQALIEVHRVLRPGGRLRLLEHVRGQRQPLRLLTDVLQPFWFAIQGSCHLNRETAELVSAAGFKIERLTSHAWGLVQIIDAVVN